MVETSEIEVVPRHSEAGGRPAPQGAELRRDEQTGEQRSEQFRGDTGGRRPTGAGGAEPRGREERSDELAPAPGGGREAVAERMLHSAERTQ